VLNNYSLITNILHSISKTPSTTEEEFEAKFETQNKMLKTASRYGRVAQLVMLGGLIRFCLKTDHTKSKVVLGILYFYWSPHVLTLGGHLGMLMNTKWACDQLNVPNTKTGRLTELFIKKLKERQFDRSNGKPVVTESKFQQDFFIEVYGPSTQKFFEKSYVANDYFSKNYDKYTKKSPDDKDALHVFSENPELEYEESLKVPYLPESFDCLLTRYVYNHAARFTRRFGAFLGLMEFK
jgi:hypothetical protein